MSGEREDKVREEVRSRYEQIAGSGRGCCVGEICCSSAGPDPLASLRLGYGLEDLRAAPVGSDMGLGCGNPQAIANLKQGEVVLDLGSGGGFDCFLAARRVGDSGRVIGVDMTPEMVTKAGVNARKAGFDQVEFRLGEIENLPVADGSVDVIMSNCVINLSPDKGRVFREAWRVLRPGGRLAISDVVAIGEMPDAMKENPAAYCGCVGGAIPVVELEAMLSVAGFRDVTITVQEQSREFIQSWLPGSGAERVVRSAAIEAKKGDKS